MMHPPQWFTIADEAERRALIRTAAVDETIVAVRVALARFTADVFADTGKEIHFLGHYLGSDRKDGVSPFGHGNDEAVAISLLLRIASQLVSASADLISDGRAYAGSALIRQLVEVEYLAWAFETKDAEAARWLRSTKDERQTFFAPAKLRKAADGRFRGTDYGHHCELGGHPVPGSGILLNGDDAMPQLMLSDALGHAGRIWDHIVDWARGSTHGDAVVNRVPEMVKRYREWKASDPLTELPPPP